MYPLKHPMKCGCRLLVIFCLSLYFFTLEFAPVSIAAECQNWQTLHPDWIFCDDFETNAPLVGTGRYFEHNSDGGDFVVLDHVGLDGSKAMRALWQTDEVSAGGLKLGFGRNPSGYMNKGIRSGEDFREIYYRLYLKMQDGWQGNPAKLSRATVIAADDWSQAMIAHLWSDGQDHLLVDPVRCVDGNSRVKCVGYNDFAHMDWLGYQSGTTPIFDSDHDDRWFCIEAHVRLNDPGQSNGVQEFWIDGQREARRSGLDFVKSYTAYGLNAVFIANYWNAGAPKVQERYIDNFVVSTSPIGCGPSNASTAYVSKDPRCDGHWPCYTSIGSAVSSQGNGSLIMITGDEYDEDVRLTTDKHLILSGGWDSDYTTQSLKTGINALTIEKGSLLTELIDLNGP